MASGHRPRTDYGTVVLHLVLLGAFLVLLATGLRIASDDPDAMWLTVLDPILPVEHLWYRHLVAGVVLTSALVAYVVYVTKARLRARMRFDVARFVSIWRGGKPRLSALNVAVAWMLLGFLLVEIVSGVVLFLGGAQEIVALHLWATWACLLCVIAHVSLHAIYGGLGQLLRIFRPGRLHLAKPGPDLAELLAEQLQQRHVPGLANTDARGGSKGDSRGSVNAHPFATALAAFLVLAGLACGSERLTRPVLTIEAIAKSEAPKIDGDLSDPAWSKSAVSVVMTTQGGDFGGTHQSRVEIRALHDGEYAYFAFTWDDPTRSLKHLPLLKDQDGWHVVASRGDLVDESVYNEDKFAVLLSPGGLPLIGAAIHLSVVPLLGRPPASSGRGMHYTLDGSILDVWQWRASHGGPNGHIENCHFGGPSNSEDRDEANPNYDGGFAVDPGPPRYVSNFVTDGTGRELSVVPRRLPKNIAAMREAMGRISDATNESESETARWWMTGSESVAYSATGDAALPLGTIIPGIIVPDSFETKRDDVRGFGRWAAGRWTLELVRRLKTDSRYDVEIKDGVLLWVAAFDHSEKRHTRHLRPFQLKLK